MSAYKGAIAFGLVYIPITLNLCIKENDLGFNLIDKKTMSRVKYKKTCVDCDDKEVKNENIVKGYQYEKDKYVIFTDEDFDKIKSPKDKNITIDRFIDVKEIDPIYFDKAYYVTPNGSDKAFYLLVSAMQKLNKAGIAKCVLGTKDTLILLRVSNGNMILNTMFFKEEIVSLPEVKKEKINKAELDLATTLIQNMSGKFEPEKYKDEYNDKVKKAIKQKVAGKKIISASNYKEPQKVINLLDALKKSIKANAPKDKPKTTKSKKGLKLVG